MRNAAILIQVTVLACTAFAARPHIPSIAAVPVATGEVVTSRPIEPSCTNLPPSAVVQYAFPAEWIPEEKLVEILGLCRETGVSHEDLSRLVGLAKTERTPAETLITVLTIARESRVSVAVLADIYEIARCPSTDVERLVEMFVAAAMAGVQPEDLRKLMALAKINGGLQSRFDVLNPGYFSRMWAVKMRAKEIEKAGKNTDELWKTYWRLFESSLLSDDVSEDKE